MPVMAKLYAIARIMSIDFLDLRDIIGRFLVRRHPSIASDSESIGHPVDIVEPGGNEIDLQYPSVIKTVPAKVLHILELNL